MSLILEPLHDQIVVLADEAESKSKGGIVLPDRSKRIPWRGTVIAVGPEVGPARHFNKAEIDFILCACGDAEGRTSEVDAVVDSLREKLTKPQIKVGDRVYWAQYSGTQYDLEWKHYFILQQKEILGKIVEGEYDLSNLKGFSLEGAEYVSSMTDKDFDYASQVRPKTALEQQQEHEAQEMLRKG